MTDPILNTHALRQPQTRRLLLIIGAALVALILIIAIWQTTGTHGAKRSLAAANDKVAAKQAEVDDAKRTLDQKVAELRALQADADAEATKLGNAVDAKVAGEVGDAQPAAVALDPTQDYYVRDRRGRFVRVAAPVTVQRVP